ncbi:MAG: Fic family protein, partial [Chloroflexi bacterium]|nr:Fic family protein [Chloroflexota bacterium]
MDKLKSVAGTPFEYYESIDGRLSELDARVTEMRRAGKLSPSALEHIHNYFKIKGIYHSNAIEGNALTIGETQLVVEMGMTITGKSLRDQAEAKNLSQANDYMRYLATRQEQPITMSDIRQVHKLILTDIDETNASRYREDEVRISGSDYEPPAAHLVPQQMTDLGLYIATVTDAESRLQNYPIVCAAAAHAWLAQIHPFIDGNGRTARIMTQLILTRMGYTSCIITREDRLLYYDALEESQAGDLTPLIEIMYENVEESLQEWEKAAEEEEKRRKLIKTISYLLEGPELNRATNEYTVWLSGMELLKNYFRRIVDDVNETMTLGSVKVHFKEYGTLEFDKYRNLRNQITAKRTWFFRIIFERGDRRMRYLFYFGYANHRLTNRSPVVLILAKGIGYEWE